MALKRTILIGVVALGLVAAIAYLRDPPWLVAVTSGLGRWERDETGEPYRWTAARASFFVPSDVRGFVLTARALKETPADWPINATITVDDRPAAVVAFPDEGWRDVRVSLPTPGGRRVRRIDIKLDRVRTHHRGLQLRHLRIDR